MAKISGTLCMAALLAVGAANLAPASADQTTSALKRSAPRRPAKRPKLVSMDFVNADLVYVVKMLAREMGRNVYIGPGVEGSVTVSLKAVPVDGAMALILKMQPKDITYKLVGYDTLIVATPDKVGQIEDDIMSLQIRPGVNNNAIRQETLPGK